MKLSPTTLAPQRKRELLDRAAVCIANWTGLDWIPTSWIRDSPGHVGGDSLDIAPRLRNPELQRRYGLYAGTDPTIHLRPTLMNALARLAFERKDWIPSDMLILIAVENDHLHLQLSRAMDARDGSRLIVLPFGQDMSHRYMDSRSKQRARLTGQR